MTSGTRCPVCGRQLPARDRPHGGRNARYCSGACKAKAYRARQQAGQPADRQPIPPAARHARVVDIRQQVSELVGIMADAASGQQPLFVSPGAARRRARPAETARTLHRLIAELAALAVTATVTERVTIRQAPGGTAQTMALFDEGSNDGQHVPAAPIARPGRGYSGSSDIRLRQRKSPTRPSGDAGNRPPR